MNDQIMEVLTPRRMMTVGNLALQFEVKPEDLHEHLKELDAAGRIRYALSKCNGACSTCSTCTTSPSGEIIEEKPAIDPTTIVISLEIRPSDD
jgi:predicted metal-binding protein